IGSPLGQQNSVTKGVISALHRSISVPDPATGNTENILNAIQTDAQINPGNSGGPLLNSAGQVVGVNFAIEQAQAGPGLGFALDGNAARDIANQLIQTGHVNRPFLGVTYNQLDETAAAANGLVVGAVVTSIPGWPAGSTPPAVIVERTQNRAHGDYSVTLPLKLAKTLRRAPMAIATELSTAMALPPSLGRTVLAPPGFINITLEPAWLQAQLALIADAGEQWGRNDLGGSQRVQVEFVSANPTGPLLFSHARGAVVGDVAARILEASG